MYGALVLLGLAAFSADIAPPAVRPLLSLQEGESLENLHAKMQRAIEAGRYEEALVSAKALAAHPELVDLPEEGRHAIDYLIGVLQLQLGRPGLALDPLVRATEWPGATREQWFMRLGAYGAARDIEGSARTLILLLDRFPGAAEELGGAYALQLAVGPEPDPDTAFKVRQALFDAGWRHDADSQVWMKLLDDLIARDRATEAGPVIARVAAPSAQLQLFALRRYDVVRAAPVDFDPVAAYASDLIVVQERANAETATVEQRSGLVSTLFSLGRFEEALAAADAILAAPPPSLEAEPEAETHLIWVMDTRARVLLLLGREEEAVEQQRAAAARLEFGQPNVSQVINLGWLSLRLDRPSDALAAVADISKDEVSRYGWMQTILVRGCAARGLSDAATAEPAFAQLDANWRDAPTAAYAASACRGDEDGMARVLVHMLSDPEHANVGVALLHDYLDTGDVTPFDRRLAALHHRVAARPEVVSARDQVGRGFAVPTIGAQF